jgi:hypothetical protein
MRRARGAVRRLLRAQAAALAHARVGIGIGGELCARVWQAANKTRLERAAARRPAGERGALQRLHLDRLLCV